MKQNDAARLEEATRALRRFEPKPTRDAAEDVWAHLQSPSLLSRFRPMMAPMAAAAMLLLITLGGLTMRRWTAHEATAPGRGRVFVEANAIVLEDGTRVEGGRVLHTRAPAEIRSARLTVHTEAETRVRLIDLPPEEPRLELLGGEIEIELQAAQLTTVVLGATELHLLGVQARIRTEARQSKLTAGDSALRVELEGRTENLAPGQSIILKTQAAPATVVPTAEPKAAPAAVTEAAPAAAAPSSSKLGAVAASPTSAQPAVAPSAEAGELDSEHTPEAQLDLAHRVAASDATRAETLAREVLGRAPSPKLEARALAILADARRRNRANDEAAALYRQVAEHPSGAPYAEEALYQAARLLFEMKRHKEALLALTEAHRRFESGPLGPERHALAALIYEATGAYQEARRALEEAKGRAERAGDGASAARIQQQIDGLHQKK